MNDFNKTQIELLNNVIKQLVELHSVHYDKSVQYTKDWELNDICKFNKYNYDDVAKVIRLACNLLAFTKHDIENNKIINYKEIVEISMKHN